MLSLGTESSIASLSFVGEAFSMQCILQIELPLLCTSLPSIDKSLWNESQLEY